MVTTGEVQVSTSAGLPGSPSALTTESLTTYCPSGNVKVLLPANVVPSQEKAKKLVGVLFRGRWSSRKAVCHALPGG
jgi:hypothetical protein